MRSAVLAVATLLLVAAGTAANRPPSAPATAEARRLARIRAHFDSVLAELDVPARAPVSPAVAGRRHALLATLRAYRDRGDFPRNYDFPGRAVPYFVDRVTGTRCAVAHLLHTTGRDDIVQRVARTNNNVWVADLAGDTAFGGWLRANGITLAEAARIQVPYMVETPTPAQQARNAAFAVVSPIAAAGSLVTGVLNARGNADGHSRATNLAGLTSGVATTTLAFVSWHKPGVPVAASAAGAALGGASLVLALRSIDRHDAMVLATRAESRTAQSPRAPVAATVAPWMPADGRGAGVTVGLTF